MSEPPTGIERRRSPRHPLQLPLRFRARSPGGPTGEADGEAINISYHGILARAAGEFRAGSEVTVENRQNGRTTPYRIVWIAPCSPGEWEMGLELIRGEPTLWDIDFSAEWPRPAD
ncbi:MAG: PilZ domain-containing protein [Acidobacteria bacterium]|nr:PilZ domain-containing protein [Acidobacteriota bacterium]